MVDGGRRKMVLETFFVVFAGFLHLSEGYTQGAPDSACQTMLPGHSFKPQDGSPPARLTVASELVRPGDIVEFTLEGDRPFMGFIIQVRDAKTLTRQIGSFISTSEDANYMTCGRGIHNSLTHRSSALKEKLTAKWLAPSDLQKQEVVFLFTVLSDYRSFWVQQKGTKVSVSPLKSEVDEVEVETTTLEFPEGIEEITEITVIQSSNDEIPEEDVEVVQKLAEVHDHRHDFLEVVDKGLSQKPVYQDLDFPQPSQKSEDPINLAVAQESFDSALDSYTPIYISSTTTIYRESTTETTTKEALPLINGQLQYTDPLDDIYEGCNKTKACFGIPDNCVETRKCEAVVTYIFDKLKYKFEMKALSSGYVSFGLSADAKMGEDLTTNCVVQDNGNVGIVTAYNYGKSNGLPKIKKEEDGIVERLEQGWKDGWIRCSWVRDRTVVIEREIWDLEAKKYHIMLAVGKVEDNQLRYHDKKTVSGVPLGLGQVGLIAAKPRLYIVLHGAFMVAAWVCAASIGIMIARYCKQTWTNHKIAGLDQWFFWHRLLMILVWCLSIVGLALIVIDVEGFTPTWKSNPHAIMGFVTVGLAFLQPFFALLRCGPGHKHRWVFNWIHWLVGNAAQFLGILCVFFAVDLDKAQLPAETDYLLITFVAFHLIAHLFMSILNCMADSKAEKMGGLKYPPRGPYHPYHHGQYPVPRHQPGHPFPDYEELKKDAPGTGARTFGLVAYILLNMTVSAALILMIVMAPVRPTFVNWGLLEK